MSSIFGVTSSSDSYDNLSIFYKSAASNAKSSSIDVSGIATGVLGDYSLIRSGSYKKLLSAYYNTQNKSSVTSAEEKQEKMNLSTVSQDAQSLNSAVTKLMSTEITEDNRDTLSKQLKSFTEEYNKIIKSGAEVNDVSVLRNVVWMTQSTHANAGVLSDIGITVKSDNTLSFDADKFVKSRLSTMSSLNIGIDSFMGRLASRTAQISSSAVNAVSNATATAYNKTGSSSTSDTSGSIINSLS